jgi:hypothetical protein
MVMHDTPNVNVDFPHWVAIHNPRVQGHNRTADGIIGYLAYVFIAS